MKAIRIRTTIDSETLHLPELRGWLGQTVEIIVLADESAPAIQAGTGDWDTAMQAVQDLDDYDYDAVQQQRDCDLKHALDHVP